MPIIIPQGAGSDPLADNVVPDVGEAVLNGQIEIVKHFYENRLIEFTDGYLWELLQDANSNNRLEIFKLLLGYFNANENVNKYHLDNDSAEGISEQRL